MRQQAKATIVILLFGIFTYSSCFGAEPISPPPDSSRSEIEELNAERVRCLNKENVAGLYTLLHPRVTLIWPAELPPCP